MEKIIKLLMCVGFLSYAGSALVCSTFHSLGYKAAYNAATRELVYQRSGAKNRQQVVLVELAGVHQKRAVAKELQTEQKQRALYAKMLVQLGAYQKALEDFQKYCDTIDAENTLRLAEQNRQDHLLFALTKSPKQMVPTQLTLSDDLSRQRAALCPTNSTQRV